MPKATTKPKPKMTPAERQAHASALKVARRSAKLMFDAVYARVYARSLAVLLSE